MESSMIILLFGVTNVGKTVTGEKLAEKLNFPFIDMDEEIKKRFKTTLEIFMQDHPFSYERSQIKGNLLKDLLTENKDNIVIAVTVIYYSEFFDSFLDMENVIAIELQDSKEHIFDRLVFSDENDIVYKDDLYKEEHKDYYMNDIHEDILYAENLFKKIKNKYFINNQSVDEVADGLIFMIHNMYKDIGQ